MSTTTRPATEVKTSRGLSFPKHSGHYIATHVWAALQADEADELRLNRAATILAARFLWWVYWGTGAGRTEDFIEYLLQCITSGTGADLPEEEIRRISSEVRDCQEVGGGFTTSLVPNALVHLLDGKPARKRPTGRGPSQALQAREDELWDAEEWEGGGDE